METHSDKAKIAALVSGALLVLGLSAGPLAGKRKM